MFYNKKCIKHWIGFLFYFLLLLVTAC